MPYDLVVLHAAELVTLSGPAGPRVAPTSADIGIIRDGAVAIEDGRIAAIGPSSQIAKLPADRRLDASGRTVVPGFVDAHTHVVFAGSREDELARKLQGVPYRTILAEGGGIQKTVRETRGASVERLVAESLPRCASMLLHGTTTAEAKSGYGLEFSAEQRQLVAMHRLTEAGPLELVPTFLPLHALPPEANDRRDEFVRAAAEDWVPRIGKSGLARAVDAFVEDGAFTAEEARRVFAAAERAGLSRKVHADEFSSCGGAELAADVGATSADHLVHASDRGLARMAEAGVVGVLAPGTILSSSLPPPDVARFRSGKVPLALGTDLNPNTWLESMQVAMQLSCLALRLTPAEALAAGTRNAAFATGVGDRVGSLEVGKQADLVVLDVPSHVWVFYRFGVNLARDVVKRGRVVIRDGARVP
ncbi:MAG: imidazolonepropionase [Methanobacteriota archaeon]